jgi:hypothetical protein
MLAGVRSKCHGRCKQRRKGILTGILNDVLFFHNKSKFSASLYTFPYSFHTLPIAQHFLAFATKEHQNSPSKLYPLHFLRPLIQGPKLPTPMATPHHFYISQYVSTANSKAYTPHTICSLSPACKCLSTNRRINRKLNHIEAINREQTRKIQLPEEPQETNRRTKKGQR